jgi:hypothetical protein
MLEMRESAVSVVRGSKHRRLENLLKLVRLDGSFGLYFGISNTIKNIRNAVILALSGLWYYLRLGFGMTG